MDKPGLRFAQIVDYDINTDDCLATFRYSYQKIAGVQAFMFLTPKEEKAVRDWWAEHGDGNPLGEMVFSLRKNQLPEELKFWPTTIFEKGAYITSSQRLMGFDVTSSYDPPPDPPKPVKHYKKGEAITSKVGEKFTIEGCYVMEPQKMRPTKTLRLFVIQGLPRKDSV